MEDSYSILHLLFLILIFILLVIDLIISYRRHQTFKKIKKEHEKTMKFLKIMKT